ncbi:DUF2384 domain-containing protein [Pseudomonas monteilii]|uniref:antitoxin Xre/MbcA/ParS toxin-binding domain-containing protein n=1 Tax=Pseudomonas TaxID=286 RepID=UPI000683D940|nr:MULTISPECIES: antitoxin Xre/MbcA/ParS toxin-binding domain-containing protein [Pseudomonas]MBA1317254.1 DUF2384 domain-containing protein [Pseudomonas monteilii]MDH0022726.1 MbcA/ParS/Xre antitoxin family protein [Pseudomonas monteilii]
MNNFNESILSQRYRCVLQLGDDDNLFGFQCEDGWVEVLEGALRVSVRYAQEEGVDFKIDQVKEKFGALRIYHRGGDVTIDRIFDVVELVSCFICENCGAPGRLREVAGWSQVKCLKHQLPGRSNDRSLRANILVAEAQGTTYSESYAKAVSLLLWFFGDKYASWLNQECLALGGLKPAEALATTEGCEEVCKLIKRLEHGVAT